MYHKALRRRSRHRRTLPFTGLTSLVAVAAFALLMAAGALWRIVPRTQA